MLTKDLQNTLTLVLAGGQGGRLKPLTERRAKPAVPFGGIYRLIDFTLSNCVHSGLRRIYVLTQYQALSLEEHLRFAWNFLPRRLRQFISALAPHHILEGRWYAGTADAIYHNLDTIKEEAPDRVLILSGDHIYKMNYGRMLEAHIRHGAALTVGVVKIPVEESSRFGIFECDDAKRALAFEEKPPRGKELPGEPGFCLGSMGIYLFETEHLVRYLEEDAALGDASTHDFGRDVIPRMVAAEKVQAHALEGHGGTAPYWRDVGTIDAYYEANLDLCSISPQFNLYDEEWPIYTLWHNDPPAKTVLNEEGRRAEVVDSLLCPGVVVSGGTVRHSLLANRVFVDEGATVEDAVLLSGVVVGKGARIRRAIIDKWTEVPEGETVGYDLEHDRERFKVTDSGIVVVGRAQHVIRDWDVATPGRR
ncbi:MAG: glucose-1-phosphate adenylyltransferase [Planctomycetota bacterium]|jgi:glucose-1-phosphate adenylyltransferase